MAKLILLFTILLSGVVFLVIPNTTVPVAFFPFSEMKLHSATYIYFAFEKLALIVLAYIVASEERKYRLETQVFFYLMVADFADYLLTYNAHWFHIGVFPVSMNIMKVLIFGILILRAWKTLIGDRSSGY